MRRHAAVPAIFCLLAIGPAALPAAAQLPSGMPGIPNIQMAPAFGTGSQNRFVRPVAFKEVPGKPGHFLVAEIQKGSLWVLAPEGAGHAKKLFWNVQVKTANSMGLFGLAFHPDFPRNRRYYVQYNPLAGNRSLRIEERIAATSLLEDSGEPGKVLLDIPLPPEFDGHQGGDLGFGPDGYLYIGVGDGGWSCYTADCADIHNHGQNRKTLLAKMLRIDVDRAAGSLPYGIPKDNPFVDDPDPAVRREIWAYGLRNPWRWTFNPKNGDLLVADVGANLAEEVNRVVKGGNYGWKAAEGAGCRIAGTCDPSAYRAPLASLARRQAACIIGGEVFQGRAGSPFDGAYIFADYVTRRAFALTYAGDVLKELRDIGATPAAITSVGRDSQGNLYMVGEGGSIYRLSHPDLEPLPTASVPAPERPGGARPRALARSPGGGYRFHSDGWPGASGLDLHTWQGRLVRRISADELEAGIHLDLPAGLLVVRTIRGSARPSPATLSTIHPE